MLSFYLSNTYAKERIISLKPNITEILFELGLGDQIVGVTQYCNYPPEATVIDKVANYVHADVERIMALRPTMIIGSKENSVKKEIEFLQKRGLKIVLLPFGRLHTTYESIMRLGEIFGVSEEAHRIKTKMQNEIRILSDAKKESLTDERILIVVGTRPVVVAGPYNLLDDLLRLMGGMNVARGSTLRYPTYSAEMLIASRPTVIIDMTMGSETRNRDEALRSYEKFYSIPAVRNKRIYLLSIDDFSASPRLVIGAKKLAQAL